MTRDAQHIEVIGIGIVRQHPVRCDVQDAVLVDGRGVIVGGRRNVGQHDRKVFEVCRVEVEGREFEHRAAVAQRIGVRRQEGLEVRQVLLQASERMLAVGQCQLQRVEAGPAVVDVVGAEVGKVGTGPKILHHGVVGGIVTQLAVHQIVAGTAVEVVIEGQAITGTAARTPHRSPAGPRTTARAVRRWMIAVKGVVAVTAQEFVVALAADQQVVTGTAVEIVIVRERAAGAAAATRPPHVAIKRVVTVAAQKDIVALAADQQVVAGAAVEIVVEAQRAAGAAAATSGPAPGIAVERVIAVTAEQPVVARAAG